MKVFKCLLFISFLGLSIIGFSQVTDVTGRISIFSSKSKYGGVIKYVKGAYITASFTTPAWSDDYGNFSLRFVGIDPRTAVHIKVTKDSFEVVNDFELERLVIGRLSPIQVFLAKKGELAQAEIDLLQSRGVAERAI